MKQKKTIIYKLTWKNKFQYLFGTGSVYKAPKLRAIRENNFPWISSFDCKQLSSFFFNFIFHILITNRVKLNLYTSKMLNYITQVSEQN